ncbi:MAG: Rpn family recombination-promoting nuclease/putative transposase, partial [Prevotellaceae bacterium]|nr:Rpn family recombination-promoting nuclease/putative transposase [Prevotellaceae bacterium]
MARYLDPKNYFLFTKIFGEHEHLLISFLNALLPLQQGQEIVSIKYLTPEQAPRKLLSKDILIYANCVDSHWHNFVVGLQVEWNTRFTRRLALKASEAFVRQPSGENADGA